MTESVVLCEGFYDRAFWAGLLTHLGDSHSAYVNVSSAFETPTATELGNQPTGAGGINRDLQPQRSLTYEFGVKVSVATTVSFGCNFGSDAILVHP